MSHLIPKPDCWYGDWHEGCLRRWVVTPSTGMLNRVNFDNPIRNGVVATKAWRTLQAVCEEPYARME